MGRSESEKGKNMSTPDDNATFGARVSRWWFSRPKWLQAGIAVIAVLFAIGVIGSLADTGGSQASPETVTVTETQVVETTPAALQDQQAKPASRPSTHSGQRAVRVVPDVTGDRLDVAESKLDRLRIRYEEIGGGTFGVVVASNWIVCDQAPRDGSRARSVKLIVDRPGDCGSAARSTESGSKSTLPDLRGLRLDVAEDRLEDLGIAYEEIGGGLFGIVDRSNWEVCDQDPGSGSSSQHVQLIVERPGEC